MQNYKLLTLRIVPKQMRLILNFKLKVIKEKQIYYK